MDIIRGTRLEFPCGATAVVKEITGTTAHVVIEQDTGIYMVDENHVSTGECVDRIAIAFNTKAVDKLIEFLTSFKEQWGAGRLWPYTAE